MNLPDEIINAVFGGMRDTDHLYDAYKGIINAIPDNWVKVDGEWHHIPDEHFVTVDIIDTPWGAHSQRIDWRMEHSLPCRIKGMKDCPVQEVWEEHLDADGILPENGRYRIWVTKTSDDYVKEIVARQHGDIERHRTIKWESVGGD